MGKRTIFFIALIFISGLMVTTAGAVPVIIGFKDKAHPEMVQPYGKVTHSYKYIPAVAADLPEQAIENLKKNKNIAYIVLDYEIKALGETLPWGIEKIGAPQVHASGNKGYGVNVAVIDTGIYYTHPDLNDNYKGGYDFVNNDDDPMDDNGHGTHCAGIIAAVDNDIGVIGVAPEANLYALKILDSTGRGSSSNLIAAIEWAIDTHGNDGNNSNDIQIISMSLGSDSGTPALDSICTAAYDSGILLVAAAGNDYDASVSNTVDYPGGYGSVIAVAATDSADQRAYFSSTGPAVELAAPGIGILSTYWTRRLRSIYETLSGTSMACPHVAGTAALVWATHSDWNNYDVRARLQETAIDLTNDGNDRDIYFGYGLVNAEAAAADTEPPKITYVNANPDTSSATITWTTDEASSSTVRYGTDTSNFKEESNPTQVTSHTVELTGLDPATIYYYEVLSSDAAGNTAVDNNTLNYHTFTTLPPDTEPPIITNVNANAVTNSATITWDTNEDSNSTVIYLKEGDATSQIKSINVITTAHVVELENLIANTNYSYQVKSTDASGNTNDSGTYEFTTGDAPAEIEMWVNDISMEIEKAGANTRGLATVSVDGVNGLVGGATVYGYWEFDGKTLGTTSGTTDSSGNIELDSSWVKKAKTGTFTFTATEITKEGYAYNSTRNLESSDSISI